MQTFQPRSARSRAQRAPSPVAEPVTIATLLASAMSLPPSRASLCGAIALLGLSSSFAAGPKQPLAPSTVAYPRELEEQLVERVGQQSGPLALTRCGNCEPILWPC